jgi:hypothetical protein
MKTLQLLQLLHLGRLLLLLLLLPLSPPVLVPQTLGGAQNAPLTQPLVPPPPASLSL